MHWFPSAIVIALAVSSNAAVVAQDLKPALRMQAEFLTPGGRAIEAISPDQPFMIRAAISSDLSSEPPAGLDLFGWLRRIDSGDLPCGQAAETFMRTGRLPIGTVFMNDPVIGVVTEDRAFVVSDPDFSLANANIVGAITFDTMPSAIMSDPVGRRFLLALPEEDRVVAVDSTGTAVGSFDGLDMPVQAAPSGPEGVIVRQQNGALLRLDPDNNRQIIAEAVTAIRTTTEAKWLVALEAGRVLLIAAADGRADVQLSVPGLSDAAVLSEVEAERPFGLAVLAEQQVRIHYLDSLDKPVEIALPGPAKRLVTDPHGRVALAWSPEGGPVYVIDVARGRIARSVNSPEAVSEIAFSNRSAFLMLASQTHVGALDLQAIARDELAEFREIQIGTASPAADHDRQLLASLWPIDGMLAIHADTYQGYQIMDGSVMGDSPAMTAVSLRGGPPRLAVVLDRSFYETSPGIFEGITSLPGPGRFELVATTGLGALSFCAEVPVAEPGDAASIMLGTVEARREGEAIRLVLAGPEGKPVADMSGQVSFSTLSGSWRANAEVHTDAEGVSELTYLLPALTQIVVRVNMMEGPVYTPLLIETETP